MKPLVEGYQSEVIVDPLPTPILNIVPEYLLYLFDLCGGFPLWFWSLAGFILRDCPTALCYSPTSGSKVQVSSSHSEPSWTRLYLKVPLIPLLDLIPESSPAPDWFWFQDVLVQMDADSCSALIPTDSRNSLQNKST